MTPRECVETALRGGCTDRVPFTMYECMIPQCEAERRMRNRGLCILHRMSVIRTHQPNVKTTQHVYWENGKRMIRTVHDTPVGQVTTLSEPAGFTSWTHEKMFKRPEDYKVLLFMIQDERYEPDYDPLARMQQALGGDGLLRAGIGLEPLQALISGSMLSMQDFCVQWMENRDEILRLYSALVEQRRKVYPLVARSPAGHANYGGNVVPEVIGMETFRKYYLPHYQEAAEIFHRHGRLLGCHFDANCRLLAGAIAVSGLDYIEAFTPAPDTDMSLAQARRAWPKQALWLNFPSSVHLNPDAEVEQATVALLNEVKRPDGIIMGITEDMPEHRWRGSCQAIMDGLERHAREHPKLYGKARACGPA
ncbi:MAG: hypothetical protein NTW87_27025 [Planctomycetota bacterium]|nr:hypothetical protein [Planctomycetota bacterium]